MRLPASTVASALATSSAAVLSRAMRVPSSSRSLSMKGLFARRWAGSTEVATTSSGTIL